MPKLFAHGTTMTFGATAVGGLLDIPLPSDEAEEIEETDMASGGRREWRAGLIDGGTIELTIRYIQGDAGQDAMRAALGGAAEEVVVTAPGGAGAPTWTFDAAVLRFGGTLFWEGSVVERNVALRVSGAVVEGVVPA